MRRTHLPHSADPTPARAAMPRAAASAVPVRSRPPCAGADFASVPLSRRLEIADPEDASTGLQGGAAAPADRQEKLEQPATPKPADCGEQLTWNPKSPVPTDIPADTALEFAAGVDQELGAGGHTQALMDVEPTIENGRMKTVGLTLTSIIIRPRWSGGRPSAEQKKLIKRIEAFIKAHEERHRDLSRSVMQQAVCDALGKPQAEAWKILKHAMCELEPTAQEKLDASEGELQWVKDASGAVVDFKAVGVKHDYHIPGCDLSAKPQDESGSGGTNAQDGEH